MDILNLPKIRCKTCGSNVISKSFNSYQELLRDGMSQLNAFESLGIKRYCCRMEINTPIKIPFGPLPNQRIISGEENLESEEIFINPMRSEQVRAASVIETRVSLGDTSERPKKRAVKQVKIGRISKEERESKIVYPEGAPRKGKKKEPAPKPELSKEELEEMAQGLLEDIVGIYQPMADEYGEQGVNKKLIEQEREDARRIEEREKEFNKRLPKGAYRAI